MPKGLAVSKQGKHQRGLQSSYCHIQWWLRRQVASFFPSDHEDFTSWSPSHLHSLSPQTSFSGQPHIIGKQRLTQLHRGLPQPNGWILSRLCAKWRKESGKRSRKMSCPRYHLGVPDPNIQQFLKAVLLSSIMVGLRNPEPKPDRPAHGKKFVLISKSTAFPYFAKANMSCPLRLTTLKTYLIRRWHCCKDMPPATCGQGHNAFSLRLWPI